MYNIPTQAGDNYSPKKKQNGIVFLVIIVPITVFIFLIGLFYIKVFNTHGHSMQPTINDDSFVICIKSNNIETGDIIAFNSRGETKIKRVIALSGDTVDIDKEGKVRVNDKILKEDYLSSTTFGEVEIPLPHKVTYNSIFVLGDNRGNSLDSRHINIGDVSLDDIICEVKLVL